MQSNHHDGDTSDATPGSDVHQSSVSDSLASAHVRNDEASESPSNGRRAVPLKGETTPRKRCHQTRDEETPSKSHVEAECTSRQGRTALGNDTEHDGAVENDTQERRVESMPMESRETSPSAAEGLLTRLWPSAVAFDGTTPCFTALAAKVTRVGEGIRLATRREGRRPRDRRSARLPMKERREKKRVLREYLKRSGKSVGELLQETPLVLKNLEKREEWMKYLDLYCDPQQNGKRGHLKKPRIEADDFFRVSSKNRKSIVGSNCCRTKESNMEECPVNLLKDLIDAGFVKAKEKVVTFSCSNTEYLADLTDDGHIHFQRQEFDSAEDFAHYIEQTVAPTIHGDDDDVWKRVTVSGRSLDVWSHDLISRQTETPAITRPVTDLVSANQKDCLIDIHMDATQGSDRQR